MGDTVEAAYAASIAHLDQLKATAAVSAGPCKACKFATWGAYSYSKRCRHPFLQRGTFDVRSGQTDWRRVEQDREGGPCGREGRLFTPAGWHQIAWRAAKPWAPLIAFLIALAVMVLPILVFAP